MSQIQWTTKQIRQVNNETGQALLNDEQTLVSFGQDFGKLIHSKPAAVFIPKKTNEIQSVIRFAKEESLPVTIRGNGLSQCGQSLPLLGALTLSMQAFNQIVSLEGDTIWVEANSSFSQVLKATLPKGLAPYVLPYNCNLSVAGVLSAGGVGAASFKHGGINAHVAALEVIDGSGEKHIVDKSNALFHACLSGQGRFGVITKACLQLKSVQPKVVSFYLVYTDQKQWFEDIEKAKFKADYMELFCSPSIQGAKLFHSKRTPMAQWLYGLHLSINFDGPKASKFQDLFSELKPFNLLYSQDESIQSYMLRHDSRFEAMKMLGQWDLYHPWYECFVPTKALIDNLSAILDSLPIHYANLVHIIPMALQANGFFMLPESSEVTALMILNPGVPEPLKASVLEAISSLDRHLLQLGGKRYLSGFLGQDIKQTYWENHFGSQYNFWIERKKQFDPSGIFTSMLHQ